MVELLIIRVLQLQLCPRAYVNPEGWVDDLIHRDGVRLNVNGHSLEREVANMVLVYVMVVLAASALNQFDIRRIKMQLEEFGERISLHFFRNGNKRGCCIAHPACAPGCN